MKMRLKDEIILKARERDLHIYDDIILKAGDVFDLKRLNGCCCLEKDGMLLFAPEGFGKYILEEVKK